MERALREKETNRRGCGTLTSVTLGSSGRGQRVQATEANEGQVDMWSRATKAEGETAASRGQKKQAAGVVPNAMRIGLDWIWLLLSGSVWWPSGPVAGRGPDSVRLSSTPLVEPRIGIRVVGIIRPSPWIALSRAGREGQGKVETVQGGGLLSVETDGEDGWR